MSFTQAEANFGLTPFSNTFYSWNISSGMTAHIVASRTSGISPCTIVFAAYTTTATGYDEHEVFRDFGYYFDFDDPTSGNFTTTGTNSKNTKEGGAIAAHTFVVDSGSQDFEVLCNIRTPDGRQVQATVTVTVTSQDAYYSASDIIAVSNTLDTGIESQWTTGWDTNVPAGATLVSTFPDGDLNGKKVMLKRGDDFSTDGFNNGDGFYRTWVRYGSKNVTITYFGNDIDSPPLLSNLRIGYSGAQGTDFTDADYVSWGGYNENVTCDGIAARSFSVGAGSQHTGFHNCDLDCSADPVGGVIWVKGGVYGEQSLSNSTARYTNGVYVSETTLKGSNTSAPKVTLWTSGALSNLGVIGNVHHHSEEHTIRSQGSVVCGVFHDCDILGDNDWTGKHAITIRASGYNQVADISSANLDIQSDATNQQVPATRYVLIDRCFLSKGTTGGPSWTVQMSAQTTGHHELVCDSVIVNSEIETTVQTIDPPIALFGHYLTETNCVQDGIDPNVTTNGASYALDDLTNNNVQEGAVIGTITDMLSTNSNSESNNPALPSPVAPR